MKKNLINTLKEIIDERFHYNLNYLEETSNNSKFKISIFNKEFFTDEEINYIVLKFDNTDIEKFPFFNEKSDLKIICDFIIFFEFNNQIYTLLIEMKPNANYNSKAKKQLKAGAIFAHFILNTLNRFEETLNDYFELKLLSIETKINSNINNRNFYTDLAKSVSINNENNIIDYKNKTINLPELFIIFKENKHLKKQLYTF